MFSMKPRMGVATLEYQLRVYGFRVYGFRVRV
jgi:hypothetical protein